MYPGNSKVKGIAVLALFQAADSFTAQQPQPAAFGVVKKSVGLMSTAENQGFLHSLSEEELQHAHDCADNYGKCDVEDMQKMKDALHEERLRNLFAGNFDAKSPLDPVDGLDHRFLEEDLALQLELLQEELGSASYGQQQQLQQQDPLHVREMQEETFSPSVEEFDDALTLPIPAVNNVQNSIRQAEEFFLIPNGLAEVSAFGFALLILAMFPLMQ